LWLKFCISYHNHSFYMYSLLYISDGYPSIAYLLGVQLMHREGKIVSVFKHHIMKTCGDLRWNSTHSWPWHLREVSAQSVLAPVKESPVAWDPKPVWIRRWACWDSNPRRLSRSQWPGSQLQTREMRYLKLGRDFSQDKGNSARCCEGCEPGRVVYSRTNTKTRTNDGRHYCEIVYGLSCLNTLNMPTTLGGGNELIR
jgi:hypothetical protein